MQEVALKLLLTNAGSERLKTLIAKGSVITLTIALGDGKEAPSETSTLLSNRRISAKPVFLNAANKRNNSWHITAHFASSEDEFAITEIGLFIDDSQGHKNESTLLGIYFDKKNITRKMPKMDLLLDVILNLQAFSGEIVFDRKTYQPLFSFPEATTETYGTVRFADAKTIETEQAGLALSTDNLQAIITRLNQNKRTRWELTATHRLNSDGLYLPMGAVIMGQRIYGLFTNHKNEKTDKKPARELFGKSFLFADYATQTDHIVIRKINTTQAIVHSSSVVYDVKANKISWVIFKYFDQSSDNTVYTLEINTSTQKEEYNVESLPKLFTFTPNKETGSLLVYNETLLIMGAASKASKQLLISKLAVSKNSNLSLVYARKKPLLHLIQDRIYCIGGAETKDALVEIHRLDFYSDKVSQITFVPEHLTDLNLQDTEKLTSCVLGNRIYIFKPMHDRQKDSDLTFYMYDYLLNTWNTEVIEKKVFENLPEFEYVKAVSDGYYCIYLFCVSTSQAKTNLSVLKFTPS
jgi:hypothetical protein